MTAFKLLTRSMTESIWLLSGLLQFINDGFIKIRFIRLHQIPIHQIRFIRHMTVVRRCQSMFIYVDLPSQVCIEYNFWRCTQYINLFCVIFQMFMDIKCRFIINNSRLDVVLFLYLYCIDLLWLIILIWLLFLKIQNDSAIFLSLLWFKYPISYCYFVR